MLFRSKVTLVSNAPNIWVSRVAEAIGDVYTCCEKDTAIWPEHHIQIYVDDSVEKVITKTALPNWTPILFSNSKNPNVPYKQVNSIEELALYIRSLDMWASHDHWHLFDY